VPLSADSVKFERMQRTLLALLKLFEVFEGTHACLTKGVLAVEWAAVVMFVVKKAMVWEVLAASTLQARDD